MVVLPGNSRCGPASNFSFAQRAGRLHISQRTREMLTTLRIKNLALVADLTLDLQPGYNVITGETGAGKSILIGALDLALGERADRTLIRSGSDSCSVEAVFDVARLKAPLGPFLEANGLEPCENHQLLLKRVFTNAGMNRQFINGSPTSLNTLAALGEWLVDIHGPHEHQSLLKPARQLAILDAFGNLAQERQEFSERIARRSSLEAEKHALIVDEKTYAQQLDLLRFQVFEITSARLNPDEDKEVDREYGRASNAARLLELSHAALDSLSEDEAALLARAGVIGRTLQELQRLDPASAPLLGLHEQAVSVLNELRAGLSQYRDQVEVEPARLHELEQRLDLLHSLKRKYGASLADVIAFRDSAQRKLEGLEQRDALLARMNEDLSKLEADMFHAGKALSAKRRSLIPQLAKAVAKQLADLGFKQSRFELALTTFHPAELSTPCATTSDQPERVNYSGFDTVEFQFAPNPGEPLRALRAIASSGELARVMLALKTVLASQDEIPVLVFDEVDANVGGETANAVGEKMRRIAQKRQVLCITHLPQVAAQAAAHFVATKRVEEGRTICEITLVEGEGRVTELARMLGGQSEAARKHARALLEG